MRQRIRAHLHGNDPADYSILIGEKPTSSGGVRRRTSRYEMAITAFVFPGRNVDFGGSDDRFDVHCGLSAKLP
jgi:hypothetical protein